MGDEEFTEEELKILGEEPEPEPGKPEPEPEPGVPEPEPEPEPIPEPGEPEPELEPKGPVPLERFNKVYGEGKELERKLDLLRRDPQAYYEKYPDEKSEEPEPVPISDNLYADLIHLRVQSGPYDGKSLAEVHEIDPLAAMAIYNDYRDDQRETQRTTKDTQERLKRESEAEVNAFGAKMSVEMFSKEVDKLDGKEAKQMEQFVDEIVDWIGKTGRANNMEDAYFLMHRDNILKTAQVNSTKALIEGLASGEVKTVTTNKSIEGKSGYGQFMEYTVDQLTAHIDGLTDVAFKKFAKDAPKELKDKFPQAAWD